MFILKTAPRKQTGRSESKRLPSATGYRLFGYLRPFWLFMLLAAFCLLLASGTHLLFPLVAQQLLDAVFLHHSQDVLNQSTILLLLVLIVGALFSFGQDYLTSYVNERLVTNMRKELHSHLQSLPLAFFHDRRVGDIMSRVTNDVTRMQMGLTTNILNLIQELITLIGSMVIILLLNWRLTLLMALITALILLFSLLFGQPMRRRSKDVQKEMGALSSYLEETLSSRRIVKAFVRESYENHRFDRLIEQVFHQSMQLVRARTTYSTLTGLFVFSAILVVLWFGDDFSPIENQLGQSLQRNPSRTLVWRDRGPGWEIESWPTICIPCLPGSHRRGSFSTKQFLLQAPGIIRFGGASI